MKEPAKRSLAARIGIAALNLLWPGLGLLRLGLTRAGAAILLAQVGVDLLLLLFWAATGPLGFVALMLTVALVVSAHVAALAGSICLGWGPSAVRSRPPSVTGRWYALVALWLVGWLAYGPWLDAAHGFYKPFYIPSEAMEPGLVKDDHIVAWMRPSGAFRRGDVILFRMPRDNSYIKRVAGLPGDTIALVGGRVVLNGRPVAQRLIGVEPYAAAVTGDGRVRRLREQFPGEAAPHEIYDIGPTPVDDVPPTRVRPGHLFVLGDNRDNSADSRVQREAEGVEQLPVGDVTGIALYYTYGPSRRSGQRVGPAR